MKVSELESLQKDRKSPSKRSEKDSPKRGKVSKENPQKVDLNVNEKARGGWGRKDKPPQQSFGRGFHKSGLTSPNLMPLSAPASPHLEKQGKRQQGRTKFGSGNRAARS